MNALVADDSMTARFFMTACMERFGYAVSAAADGDAALSLLAGGGTFAVALVDWNMPGMDGLALVKRLRADPSRAGMKILMCTTETELSKVGQALVAGADEFVMKPFTAEVLASKLKILGLPCGEAGA